MSARIFSRDFWTEVALGRVPGHTMVRKFGAASIGTSLVPITPALTYKTPTTATALEFVSDSANDTAAGTGAREVTVIGLDSSWAVLTQAFATNGTTAVPLGTNLIRHYRTYVSASGTYATETAGSHAGNLTLQVSGGGAVWATIGLAEAAVGRGQSQIGAYTVAAGKTAWVRTIEIFCDTAKTVNVYFFHRTGADVVAAPYTPMRLSRQYVGLSGSTLSTNVSPLGPYAGPADIGFMAKVGTGTADVSVDFEILVIDN